MVKIRYMFTSFMAFMALIVIGVISMAASPLGADIPSVTDRTESAPVPASLDATIVGVAGFGVQADTTATQATEDTLNDTKNYARVDGTLTVTTIEVIRSGGEG